MPTITVLQLDPLAPVGAFGPWLGEVESLQVRIVEAWREEIPDCAAGGVVILGGTMDAYSEEPHLRAVQELIRQREAEGLPTLGICLGHQLVAVALGGSVEVGAEAGPEVGVVDVRWLDAAASDPVVGEAVRTGLTEAATDHRDAVLSPPEGALVLAESEKYVQAIRAGSTWGLQFHPEATADLVASWLAQSGHENAAAVLTSVRTAEARLAALGRSIAHSFGHLVLDRDSPHVEDDR
ncbi:MAG: type 1 glutamine amidotransferase [Actinomycetota bacterium]